MTANVQDAIVLLGDSITQGGWEAGGFAQKLAYDYARKFDVINRGFGGYNTEWIIPVFEQLLATKEEQAHTAKIRLLTIWFGANDATVPGSKQHVSLENFKHNLSQLITMVASPSSKWYSPETKIILITPPPFNIEQWKTPDRTFENTATYAQGVRDVGAQENVPVADAWTALWEGSGKDEKALSRYLSDGLHLTVEGYKVVYEELIKTIGSNYPGLHYERLRTVFVPWDEVNPEKLRESVTKRKVDA